MLGKDGERKVYQNCSNTRSVLGSIQSPIKAENAPEAILCDSRGRGKNSRFSWNWRAVCTGSECSESARRCSRNRQGIGAQEIGNHIDIWLYSDMSECLKLRTCKSRANSNSNVCLKRLFETSVCQCKWHAKKSSNSCLKQLFKTCV